MQRGECEWVEFKRDNVNPEEIGEYISALANGAALAGEDSAYLVWGVDDSNREVVGTSFAPAKTKGKGNEDLEGWLMRLLEPRIEFRFHELDVGDERVVLLRIDRHSIRRPVRFHGHAFIRIGSYKKRLDEHPERERALWRVFDHSTFESGIAREHASDDEVLALLDYSSYFDLLRLPLPDGKQNILAALQQDSLVARARPGVWNITNLGALTLAKRLSAFERLRRKALRVIIYKGNHRFEIERTLDFDKGYASGFESMVESVNNALPSNEVIEKALRKTVTMYPTLAVRELIANALIHQDFTATGSGPMIEIFTDRIEFTNPGTPLVATDRMLDAPPKSRNEALASLMRRMKICEEAGSGIDKVVWQVELFQLPAPLFESVTDSTRIVLFALRPLTKMDRSDRVRACYLHACLKYVSHDYLTNSSVRERFGISERNKAQASRLIKETVDDGLIAPQDPGAAPRLMRYVPWWASARTTPDAS